MPTITLPGLGAITGKFMEKRNTFLVILLSLALLLDVGLHFRTERALAQTNQAPVTSLNAVTTGTGTVVSCTNAIQVGWSVIWSAGVSSGVVVIEAANSSTYSGTWAQIDQLDFAAAPGANSMVTGTYPGPFQFVRARVTTNVVGGTVTATISRINGN